MKDDTAVTRTLIPSVVVDEIEILRCGGSIDNRDKKIKKGKRKKRNYRRVYKNENRGKKKENEPFRFFSKNFFQ
jgi:hypothetical protein